MESPNGPSEELVRAADKGDAEAQYKAGLAYLKVKQYDLALLYYSRSAEQGNAYSCLDLGYMYEEGLGTAKNSSLSKYWYARADNPYITYDTNETGTIPPSSLMNETPSSDNTNLPLLFHLLYVLQEAQRELSTTIHGRESLCDLCFDFKDVPDYTDKAVQCCYIIRYYLAYLCEYRYIFSDLLATLGESNIGSGLNITSFGSGCLTDYYGLLSACKDHGVEQSKITYRGFDEVDWWKPCAAEEQCSCRLLSVSRIQPADIASPDIIVFPKSLEEITESNELEALCSTLSRAPLTKRELHLVISYASPWTKGAFQSRKLVTQALREAGYRVGVEDWHRRHFQPDNLVNHTWISHYKPYFPEKAFEQIARLYEWCPNYRTCGCKRRALWREPMKKVRYLSYTIDKAIK